MGGGGSKGDDGRAERQHQQHLQEMRDQEARNEERRKQQNEMYHQQVLAAQKRSADRETKMSEERRNMENHYRTAAADRETAATRERATIASTYNKQLQEKSAEISAVREESKEEMKELRAVMDRKDEKYQENMQKMNDKMIDQERDHSNRLEELHKKQNEQTRDMYDKMLEANKETHMVQIAMIKSHAESTATAVTIMSAITSANRNEKDSRGVQSKVDSIRSIVDEMESTRRKIVIWVAAYYERKSKNKISSVLAAVSPGLKKIEEPQSLLQQIADDCHGIHNLIKFALDQLNNGEFEKEAKNAVKEALDFIRTKTADIHDECAKCKHTLIASVSSLNMEGIKTGINEIQFAISTMPELMKTTVSELVTSEMKQIGFKEKEFFNQFNNAIGGDTKVENAIEYDVKIDYSIGDDPKIEEAI